MDADQSNVPKDHVSIFHDKYWPWTSTKCIYCFYATLKGNKPIKTKKPWFENVDLALDLLNKHQTWRQQEQQWLKKHHWSCRLHARPTCIKEMKTPAQNWRIVVYELHGIRRRWCHFIAPKATSASKSATESMTESATIPANCCVLAIAQSKEAV